ncbi:MAG: AAA family ATPase [Lachnospiraceae bacterium]|nr:AAA family ATPase [Lachnospiraceae bacterium]
MVTINKLELENVKRIKTFKMQPSAKGLTVIGGNNAQGKTSVLDAIAWALGGERYRPSDPQRTGSTIPPMLKIVLSNGLIVERKGKNSSLTVTDPTGQKAGQRILDEFVEALALDLPKFMHASSKEKANTLLQIIGVGAELAELECQEKEQYNERLTIGRIADQKAKYAKEQQYFPEVPNELVSPSELLKQQQEILIRNGENQRQRNRLHEITRNKEQALERLQQLDAQIEALSAQKRGQAETYKQLVREEETAMKSVAQLQDESTAELEASIAHIEEINRKVRINMDKDKAEEDAREYARQYDELTVMLAETRKAKAALLSEAGLPLPGLSILDGELIYNGQRWDNMSGAEQLIVSTAIVRKLKPECGFVLLDKLEQMDLETLRSFGDWLEQEGLQAIATRVSTGDECSIIIEDGYAVSPEASAPAKTWKEGTF